MTDVNNEFWKQVRHLYEQEMPIRTLDWGVVNTITDINDQGLTILSSKTQNSRPITRRSLERLWQKCKQLGVITNKQDGYWDSIEMAIIGHLPNFEYATRPLRLFFVDPSTHQPGTIKRHGQSSTDGRISNGVGQVEETVVEEINEAIEQAETSAEQQEPSPVFDPVWGPFTQLNMLQAVDTSFAISIEDDDPIWLEVKSLVESGYHSIIFSGPPGTSKTWYAHQVALKLVAGRQDRVWTVQFHPSYSYEDFVEGRVPTSMHADEPFPVRPKIFLKACIQAVLLEAPFVLVIDEISRGDPSRIFGEVLTYIEHRNKRFILPYSEREAFVPSNLIILGTMNPYDKSVADLDQALQRRFQYIPMTPNSDLLQNLLTAAQAPPALCEAAQGFFTELQSKCPNRIGHAYFKDVSSWEQMQALWRQKLQRVLEDHFYPETERVDDIKRRFDHYFDRGHS